MNIVQIYKRFPNHEACIEHLEEARWNGKPRCPYCGSTRATAVPTERRYHCNSCNTSYSVTVRTIFHKTKADLQKWFLAISLILNAKKGISARQLGRDLGLNKNSAWYMAMRIRKAMATAPERDLLEGVLEMDECDLVGKPRKGGGSSSNKRGSGTKKKPVIPEIDGPNHKISLRHLQSYIDEFCYRHGHRGESDLFGDTLITPSPK